MAVRARIEAAFTEWGRFIVRWRWLGIAACLALTFVLASRLPEIRVDNSEKAFLFPDNPELIRYDRFRDQFDRDDRILVILHPPEIFAFDFLEKLRALHREIEREVPYLEEVTSLINARNTRGEGDELIVEELMEHWPEDAVELEALRARVLANPLYMNILISENAEYTVATLKPYTYSTLGPTGGELAGFEETETAEQGGSEPLYLTDEEAFELIDALIRIIERYRAPDLELHLVGGSMYEYRLFRVLQSDATIFLSLSTLLYATPGPATISLAASGATSGFRRSVPTCPES